MPNYDGSHTIRVTIEILDEHGFPVNPKGQTVSPSYPSRYPAWRTETLITASQDIKPTMDKAQALWVVLDSVTKFRKA